METITIPRAGTPDVPVTWELIHPCGTCASCLHLARMTAVVDDLFLARVRHLQVDGRYYEALDKLNLERNEAVVRLGTHCENLRVEVAPYTPAVSRTRTR